MQEKAVAAMVTISEDTEEQARSLDPYYLHDLEVLRAKVSQGDLGWGGSWTKERFRDLKENTPRLSWLSRVS